MDHAEAPKPKSFDDPDLLRPGWRRYPDTTTPRHKQHGVVRYAQSLVSHNLPEKLPRWYAFLDLVRQGKRLKVAERLSGFSAGMRHAWVHTSELRAREYALAIGDRTHAWTKRTLDDAYRDIRHVIQLRGTHRLADALQLAHVSDAAFCYFMQMHPDLRAEYEQACGYSYRWHRPLTDEDWTNFYTLLPVFGLKYATTFARPEWSLNWPVSMRMRYDDDFRAQVRRIWSDRRQAHPLVPTAPQLDDFLLMLPEVGLIEKACSLVGMPPTVVGPLRALDLSLEQRVLEQLREYDRRLNPYYARWSQTDEAHQSFETLYHQIHVREAAYQLCVQHQQRDEECQEAQFKIDHHARPTFAERHGLIPAQ